MSATTVLVESAQPYGIDRLVGDSALMTSFRNFLTRIAASPASTCLLTGEIGTGKHLAAKILHYSSSRADKPFVKVASWEEPDASDVFRRAAGGTVLLEDIAEMSPALQSALLGVIEEKSIRPLGSAESKIDVRVIAMSNCSLEPIVEAGGFRRDLYHQLNVLPIAVPALREHLEDVPALTTYYIQWFNREVRKNVLGLSSVTMRALQAYAWPGNVRELRNVIERAILLATEPSLDLSDFLLRVRHGRSTSDFDLPPQGVDLESLERSLVIQALQRCGGNQTRAAVLLGMNRDQIRYRIEKYALPRPLA